MAPSTSSSSKLNEEIPNPPTVIRRNLRNAERTKNLAYNMDASPAAANSELFPQFLKSALLNLETNVILFDTVIPNVSVEEATRLESLRAANETALAGVSAIKDADKKTRAAARRAEKKAAKQAILDADPSTIAQTLTTTTYAPGVRLTKAGIPKKKSGPKPGSRRTPKEEKPKPTQAEIEQQQARGVGQPEALALLAEHFASSPVRQLSPVKREAREEELGNPAPKRKKGEDSETPATPNDESKAEMRAIKKIKKSRLSKAAGVEEAFTPAPPMTEEMEETHTSPAKKQKKSKVSKEERKEKRISDVSMKDATPITSPVSTPVPSSTKSKKEKGRFADKFHPYKKPGKYSKKDEHHELKVEQVGITENGHEDIHETEDITAEVDEKMRRHRTRVKKEERAKELGINPSEKHARESFGTAGPSPKATQESIQDSSTSAKKRKTKKSKEEKSRFNGVVGDIERKRKSPSPDPHGVEMVVEKKGRSAEEKKKRKEEKARKRAREQTWTGEEVDGMGDVVMSGGPMSE